MIVDKYQWRNKGGGQVGNAPRGTDFGSASTHFIQTFKNAFQSEI